jgi:uroporphyrinogen III methyltransferase/synthase
LGIAAYSGIPLTHREHNKVVTFVTGHDVHGIDWSKVGQSETLVIFMGIFAIREIAAEIHAAWTLGRYSGVAVRWGTRPDQETVAGTLATIADRIEAARLKPPATVIIGEVVALREKLDWFEKLPLFGRKIVVTRARIRPPNCPIGCARSAPTHRIAGDRARTARRSRAAGSSHRKPGQLRLADFHQRQRRAILSRSTGPSRAMICASLKARICAIGPATRKAIEDLHLKVDLMPEGVRRREPGQTSALARNRARSSDCSAPMARERPPQSAAFRACSRLPRAAFE